MMAEIPSPHMLGADLVKTGKKNSPAVEGSEESSKTTDKDIAGTHMYGGEKKISFKVIEEEEEDGPQDSSGSPPPSISVAKMGERSPTSGNTLGVQQFGGGFPPKKVKIKESKKPLMKRESSFGLGNALDFIDYKKKGSILKMDNRSTNQLEVQGEAFEDAFLKMNADDEVLNSGGSQRTFAENSFIQIGSQRSEIMREVEGAPLTTPSEANMSKTMLERRRSLTNLMRRDSELLFGNKTLATAAAPAPVAEGESKAEQGDGTNLNTTGRSFKGIDLDAMRAFVDNLHADDSDDSLGLEEEKEGDESNDPRQEKREEVRMMIIKSKVARNLSAQEFDPDEVRLEVKTPVEGDVIPKRRPSLEQEIAQLTGRAQPTKDEIKLNLLHSGISRQSSQKIKAIQSVTSKTEITKVTSPTPMLTTTEDLGKQHQAPPLLIRTDSASTDESLVYEHPMEENEEGEDEGQLYQSNYFLAGRRRKSVLWAVTPYKKLQKAAKCVGTICVFFIARQKQEAVVKYIRAPSPIKDRKMKYDAASEFDASRFNRGIELKLSREARRILSLPPKKRRYEDIELALRAIKIHTLSFNDYPRRMQVALVKYGEFLLTGENRVIVKEGHKAEFFYYILSGKVSVYKKSGNEAIQVGVMTKGCSSDEMQVMLGGRRQVTLISASHEVEMLAVNRDDFIKIFVTINPLTQEPDFVSFLKQMDTFKMWAGLRHLPKFEPEICVSTFFVKGTLIAKDYRLSDFIYVIRSGKCSVVRLLSVDDKVLKKIAKRQAERERQRMHHKQPIPTKTSQITNWQQKNIQHRSRNTKLLNQKETTGDALKLSIDENTNPIFSDGLQVSDRSRSGLKQQSRSKGMPLKSSLTESEALKSSLTESETSKLLGTERKSGGEKSDIFVEIRTLEAHDTYGLEGIVYRSELEELGVIDSADIAVGTEVGLLSQGAECIVLSKAFFLKYYNERCKMKMQTRINRYPDEAEIIKRLTHQSLWDVDRKKIVQQILREHDTVKKFKPNY